MSPVLVVDDDESYRELLMLTLEDHCGVEQVLGFASGRPLLQHLATAAGPPPVLAILDLHMPDMCGLDLLRQLRRLAPDLPVAFLSGAADDDERAAGLAAGACAFLRKPIAYPELIELLQGLVRSVHAGDTTTN
jgi:CheY-like chemotaxis protein